MISNVNLIAGALRDLGVIAETETPSAEQGATGLTNLNQMLFAWEVQDIDLGYFTQSSTSDTCPIPEYSEQGVQASLALKLAPIYGATVSAELLAKQVEGMRVINNVAMNEKLRPVRTDRPLGSGHHYFRDITRG